MKDIAREAGVSISLVSYVLNDKNTGRINADTAKRIKDIAKKLNYQTNQIARSLQNKKTYTIGLIVADISNFFYSYIAGFIEDEVNKYGYNVLFGSAYENPKRFMDLLKVMVSRQVDGLILAIPDGAEECISYVQSLSIPFVIIDREFPQFKGLNTVCLDNYRSSEMVVERFYELGCRRMAAIGLDNNLFHLSERNRGFSEAAAKLVGADNVTTVKVAENVLEEQVENQLRAIVYGNKVDSICFMTNKIAMAALPILLSWGIKIPQNLSVICYDEAEAYKLFPYPISYVKQPLKDMSIEAVRFLMETSQSKVLGVQRFPAELISLKGY